MWIFATDGCKADVGVLEVWTCVAFEGFHAVPVECVVVNPNIELTID